MKLVGVANARHVSDGSVHKLTYSCFEQQYSAASYCSQRKFYSVKGYEIIQLYIHFETENIAAFNEIIFIPDKIDKSSSVVVSHCKFVRANYLR